ncbi:MAG: inorganic diphosphatase [Sphaerobacter sp.]|nr:inorganic diphosphatase [Sphaerobacter sp.]
MICEAVVEDPRGATCRHAWDPARGSWRVYRHPHAVSPWPANYGFLPGTWNPADGDALDAIILATAALPTGTRLWVRPVGLLRRPDGDHKVLAVAVDDPAYADVRWLADVPKADLAAIEAWFQEWDALGVWHDAGEAERLIRSAAARDGSPGPGAC